MALCQIRSILFCCSFQALPSRTGRPAFFPFSLQSVLSVGRVSDYFYEPLPRIERGWRSTCRRHEGARFVRAFPLNSRRQNSFPKGPPDPWRLRSRNIPVRRAKILSISRSLTGDLSNFPLLTFFKVKGKRERTKGYGEISWFFRTA